MRTFILLFTFIFGTHCFSQQQSYIEKSDGTKVTISNVRVDGIHKKVTYRVSGELKDTKVKYSGLKLISFGGYNFRMFKIGKKFEGFYILSETDTKLLGFREFFRTFTHGGFDSYVRHVDVAIFDKQDNLLERFDLRENDSEKSVEARKNTVEAIRKHFQDCPKLIERLNENYKPEDKKKATMLPIFEKPNDGIDCK